MSDFVFAVCNDNVNVNNVRNLRGSTSEIISGWDFYKVNMGPWNKENWKRCPEASWFGWNDSGEASISTILHGSGKAILDFENCNKNGNVIAYLNGEELPCTYKNQVEFDFKDGNKLEITEDGEGMIQFNNLKFIECSDNDPKVPYSPDEPEDCECNELGSVDLTCDCDGKCSCKPNVVGDTCDFCQIEHYDFPNCKGIFIFKIQTY